MDASPYDEFQTSAEPNGMFIIALRKSLCLSVSELGIFSEKEYAVRAADSLSGCDQRKCPRVKPFEELFRFLFGGVKRKE